MNLPIANANLLFVFCHSKFTPSRTMTTILWAPNTGNSTETLLSPYQKHNQYLIQPGQDFTVRLTTISKTILDKYGSLMKRGEHGNDYFCILSHFGIGSTQDTPNTSVNYVAHEKTINSDILSFWGENIRSIKDYRDTSSDGGEARVYIGASAFCQGLGSTRLDDLKKAYDQVSSLIGRFAPWLTPYTAVGKLAIDGVSNLTKKLVEHKAECKESIITLYPGSSNLPLPSGDAYLLTGSYIFFFEDIPETERSQLILTQEGRIICSTGANINIPPYLIVNIVDGIIDAPNEIYQKSIAADVLEKYTDIFSLQGSMAVRNIDNISDSLLKIGESYYYTKSLIRYQQLKEKGDSRTESENRRMKEIKKEIEDKFKSVRLEE